jgi:DNA repair protein RecO (recombination protein O)
MPLGEADLLVTLYTRERGKLRAVAKGARRSDSKLVGHLEPLTRVRLSLATGRNLDYVTQAQVIGNFTPLKNDLTGISKGFYLAELVDGFGSEASPNPPLYQLAVETLQSIAQMPDSDLPLRFFELHLLHVSGLMPELYRCVECRQALAPGHHRFSPNLGGVLCPDCHPATGHLRPLSLQALKVLRLLDRSRATEIPALRMSNALVQELKTLLAITIEYWLDKQIQSNTFLEQLHSESKSAV